MLTRQKGSVFNCYWMSSSRSATHATPRAIASRENGLGKKDVPISERAHSNLPNPNGGRERECRRKRGICAEEHDLTAMKMMAASHRRPLSLHDYGTQETKDLKPKIVRSVCHLDDGCGDPMKGREICIVDADKGGLFDEVGDGNERILAGCALSDAREDAFDSVEPGGVGWLPTPPVS